MAERDRDTPTTEYGQKWWCQRLEEVEKEMDRKWRNSGDKIVARYLDERGDDTATADMKRYNIFWANVQIMKSALYATPPHPAVTRQSGDAKDDVARTAALMLERILDIDVNKDTSDMHGAFKQGVEDRLIPGLGQVWLRYDCETEEVEVQPATPESMDPYTGQIIPAQEAIVEERIVKEAAPCDYVHWRDFLWSPARTWGEVWWVARRAWMKKKAFVKRFGQEKYDELKGNYEYERKRGTGNELPKGFSKGRVEVFEVWCEDTNKVYFVNRHCEEVLESVDDPLQLDDFFPCPKPLMATHSTSNFSPRADFTLTQDQYEELDVLNDRISTLTKALRVVGVYDKNTPELAKLLTGQEFAMVACDNWSMLAEKGGLKGSVDWFPVDTIANVLEKLMMQRQAVIGQIYELTSISDIMRGASNGRETAKAQQLKAQYSSVRMQLSQQDVARWVTHAMKLKAEVIGRWFQPATIIEQSQIEHTESAQYAQAAVALLKDYRGSQYRIEVGEETLSIADYTAEREQRTELLTAMGQFLSQAGQMATAEPRMLPFLLKMIQWVVASFRSSSDIESVLDEGIRIVSAPKPPEADGAAAAKQAEMQAQQQTEQAKIASDEKVAMAANELKGQIANMQTQSAERIAAQNNETKVSIEQMKQELTQMIEGANQQASESQTQMQDLLERLQLAQEEKLSDMQRQHEQQMLKYEVDNRPEPAGDKD